MPRTKSSSLGRRVCVALALSGCGDDIPDLVEQASSGLPPGIAPSTSTGADPLPLTSSSNDTIAPGSSSTDASDTTSAVDDASDTTDGGSTSTGSACESESTGSPPDFDGPYDDCINAPATVCDPGAVCFTDDVALPTVGVCAPQPCADASQCPAIADADAVPQCSDLDGDLSDECSLDCSGGASCPPAMVCWTDSICVHEIDIPLPCTDIDLGDALPASASGSTAGAGNDTSAACTAGDAADVTLEWTAPVGGTFSIRTAGSSFDTVLYVLDDCGGAQIACNDDVPGSLTSLIQLDVAAGETILVVVDGFNTTGDYELTIDVLSFDGDCCEVHEGPGCEVTPIESCVCALDNFCCIVEWDDLCVDNALEDCGASCP